MALARVVLRPERPSQTRRPPRELTGQGRTPTESPEKSYLGKNLFEWNSNQSLHFGGGQPESLRLDHHTGLLELGVDVSRCISELDDACDDDCRANPDHNCTDPRA